MEPVALHALEVAAPQAVVLLEVPDERLYGLAPLEQAPPLRAQTLEPKSGSYPVAGMVFVGLNGPSVGAMRSLT
jgi:hypothetical protein